MNEENVDVVVVGGGLVGLSTAAFLAMHGVRTHVVERHGGIPTHPRARGTNPRTMELMRTLGVEAAIRASRSARALADNAGVIAVESLAGREIGELRQSYHVDSAGDYSALSPTSWCLCHQDELEPILQRRAAELGAKVTFNAELVDVVQAGDGVTATVLTGPRRHRHTISASYLVAADGAQSPLRQRLGIRLDGPGVLARFLNIQFHADLREQLGDRRFIICYTTQAGMRCALLPIDNASRWLLHVLDPTGGGLDDRRCAELVRAAAGVPDLDVQVESVLPWDAAAGVAERFSAGRIFLAGDAAHVMPPSGAFGSNTGIQDGHNLAWKIAAVLNGWAGPALLDTYDAERRPVAVATVRQATLRSQDRPRLVSQTFGPPDPEIRPDPVVIFGYRYGTPGEVGGWTERPDGQPGCRAPHVPLRDGASTIDLFGRTWVLLTGPGGAAWRAAAESWSTNRNHLPVVVHERDEAWQPAYGVDADGAVLVRPDGVVAWRTSGVPGADPAGSLAAATDWLMDVPAAVTG
jgi:putative polyketide hydroxylase